MAGDTAFRLSTPLACWLAVACLGLSSPVVYTGELSVAVGNLLVQGLFLTKKSKKGWNCSG